MLLGQSLTRTWWLVLTTSTTVITLSAIASHPVRSNEVIVDEPTGAAEPAQPLRTSTAQYPAADALGDGLPNGARLRLGTHRFRHPDSVLEIALSPDEQTIVTLGSEVIAWDTATGKERWRATEQDLLRNGHGSFYGSRALCFTADGERLFTPGRPNELVIWNTASGDREVLRLRLREPLSPPRGSAYAVDVRFDGQMLAVGNSSGLVVCDSSGEELYRIKNAPDAPLEVKNADDRLGFGGDYSCGLFSADGVSLAVITSDRPEEVRLFNAQSGELARSIRVKARVVRFTRSHDGTRLVTTERDNAVRMYDVKTGDLLWSHVVTLENPFENYTSAVAISPDGELVAAGATNHHIYLLSAETGTQVQRLDGHQWYPWGLAFTKTSQLLYSSGWDGNVRRWNVATGEQLELPVGVHATGTVAASADGQKLAYCDDRQNIRIVNALNGIEERTMQLPGAGYSQLCFSPDSRTLASGGAVGDQVHLAMWNMITGDMMARWDWPKGRDPHSTVEDLAFTTDGRYLAAAVFRQSAAYVFDLEAGVQVAKLDHDHIYGLSFDKNKEVLATAGWDKKIRFWQTPTGQLLRDFEVTDPADNQNIDLRMYAVRFSPTDELIATAHLDGTVRIWQAADMKLHASFSVDDFVFGAINFSPDGLSLATGDTTGKVELWDPFTAEKVWDAGRHQGYVYTLAFSRDSKLVSGGEDGVCYLWDLNPSEVGGEKDEDELWSDFSGGNPELSYRARWQLFQSPERAVDLLGRKLRQVKTVIDRQRAIDGLSVEEAKRRSQLILQLVQKEEQTEEISTIRRATTLLAQMQTPAAIELLKELAKAEQRDISGLAASALQRMDVNKQQ